MGIAVSYVLRVQSTLKSGNTGAAQLGEQMLCVYLFSHSTETEARARWDS